jgi:hypothetical protein
MASRNKTDLYRPMIDVWDYVITVWKIRYANLPQPLLTCTYRSGVEQNELYARGRTVLTEVVNGKKVKVRKVTNAKSMESPHNIFPSMAFDVAFWDETKKSLDWSDHLFEKFWHIINEEKRFDGVVTWGGNFKSIQDRPHFEYKDWKDFKKK